MNIDETYARFGRPLRPGLPTVAYLTNQLPFPAHSGGQVREAQLLARLSERYNICLGAVTTEFERDVRNIDQSLEICAEVLLGRASDQGSGSGHRRMVDNRAFTDAWARRVRAANLVHSEGYFLMHHIPQDCRNIVLVAENIEFTLHRDRTGGHDTDPGAWIETRDRELAAWRRAAVCGTVSEQDLRLLQEAAPDVPACLTTNGWDHLADAMSVDPAFPAADPILVYTGNYSWEPTADGAHFLLSDVWPLVRARHPRVRLIVAGANPTARMRELAAGDDRVEITGRLPSLMTVLEQATAYVCPLRFSGGTEVKLVEALYAGLAVVSSPESLLGLPEQCHDAILVGADAPELAELCLRLLADEELRRRQSERARQAVSAMPSWDDAAAALEKTWIQAMA